MARILAGLRVSQFLGRAKRYALRTMCEGGGMANITTIIERLG